jgi:2-polyprenyl-6-methoxyphenol hydroxylase-like FAD-dependent oxidoreductase
MTEASPTNKEHAIVLGGSIAGLFAARVLSDHFQRVTIIERDPVHDEPESRKGQPQTRHLHGVLEPTRRFIRRYMPGLEQRLIDGGAMVGDFGELARWYHFDDYKVDTYIGLEGMSLSRPFLEWHVRRYVTSLPNIKLLGETAADELVTDASRSRITGVKITHRAGEAVTETLEADVVVDACGRGSATPKWLVQLGYDAPEEQEVKVQFGYATRIYRRETDPSKQLKTLLISPTPPLGKRGCFMFPIEGERWIVTAGGWLGDHPPADETGFMDFIRSLPTSDIYDIICHAEPLSDITLHKFPSSRRLRYDKLNRFPDGYFVVGDAVASFNPIYGQGMSSAAMQVEVLDETLKQADLHEAWSTFFRRTAKVIDLPWQLAVGEDFRYPETEGKRPLGTNLINQYVARVHRATHHDPVVYRRFLNVMHLIAPPTSLLQPAIVWRVLRGNKSQ